MKTLTLFRHAKSSWKYPVPDMHRPLNARGLEQALYMAAHCQLAQPEHILTSPASRALSTAMIYVDRLQLPSDMVQIKPALYEAGVEQLMEVIAATRDDVSRLWLFGHNPGLNMLLDNLLACTTDNLVTAAYAHLELDIMRWQDISAGTATLIEWNQDRGGAFY